MTSEECRERAIACEESAAIAKDGSIASEFLALAVHWRALSSRESLGRIFDPIAEAASGADGLTD